jgi:hypothetical protein
VATRLAAILGLSLIALAPPLSSASAQEADAVAAPWRARTARLVIRGTMPRAEIERVLEGGRRALAQCAETSGAAEVRLMLVIAATGHVASASATGGSPELARCVTATARGWRFPQTGAGITSIEVSVSFAR